MALVTRGRLSVQRVERPAWDALVLMAERGGWGALGEEKKKKNGGKTKANAATEEAAGNKPSRTGKKTVRKARRHDEDTPSPRVDGEGADRGRRGDEGEDKPNETKAVASRKRKAACEQQEDGQEDGQRRRSARLRK
jgi:hypothetical protein